MATPLTNLYSDLKSVFERTQCSWYVFGAQAAIFHGASRLTADVDVTVMHGDRSVENLVDTLTAKGFEIRVKDAAAFVAHSKVLPVWHIKSGMPVDIVFGGPGLEEEFAHRVLQCEIENVKVPIASAEDVVSMKILAGRDKDLGDALSIISAQLGKLDMPYIEKILDMLERALDRRDLIPVLNDLIRRAKKQISGLRI